VCVCVCVCACVCVCVCVRVCMYALKCCALPQVTEMLHRRLMRWHRRIRPSRSELAWNLKLVAVAVTHQKSASETEPEEVLKIDLLTIYPRLPSSSEYPKRYPQEYPPVHQGHSSITFHNSFLILLTHTAENCPFECFVFCVEIHLERRPR